MVAFSIPKSLFGLFRLQKELALGKMPYPEALNLSKMYYQEVLKGGTLRPSEKRLIEMPLKKFDFPVNVVIALAGTKLKTLGDVLYFGLKNLFKIKNFREKSFNEFVNIIEQFLQSNQAEETYIEEEQDIFDESEKIKKENGNILELVANQVISFENAILKNADRRVLKTPLDEFDFSVRISNAFKTFGLKTVEDVLIFGFNTLLKKKKNLGVKSLNELKEKISYLYKNLPEYNKEKQNKKLPVTSKLSLPEMKKNNGGDIFIGVMENIFSSFFNRGNLQKSLQIIKARYGYENGEKKTLEQIGKKTGLTRERVRQIIVKSHRHLKHPVRKKIFQVILEHIESTLLYNKGVIGVNDLLKNDFFSTGNKKQLIFLLNLISDLYEERYRVIEKKFLTSLNDIELKNFHSVMHETASNCQFPINENKFYQVIITAIGPISKDYLSYFLIQKKRPEILKGKVLSLGRLSVPQKVKLLMRNVNEPLHFTEIATLYREHYGDTKIRTSDIERAIHARISDSKDFIIVNPGTFMLREKFKIPNNIEEIIKTSKTTLQNLNTISDTKYLIKELQRRGVKVGNLNEYSLKPILLEYPGFVGYRKFEIGIDELADKYERKSLSDLIYEVLSSTDKPLHAKEIWKQISKQRGFPRYAIDQKLCDEPQFIKTAPSTYTVKENIPSYDKKYRLIIDFTKEWINLKGHAVSAFFVSEVLKGTEEIKDLSIGLVEHVLATCPEFTKLPNGFYDLVSRQ
jgi:DNA-directed RNA polymerase alpha subunit